MTFYNGFKSTVLHTAAVAMAVLLTTGCADSIVSECDIPAGQLPVTSRFSDIEQKVLVLSCAVAGCHAGANPQAGLDLSAGKAYDALVNVQSLYYPTQMRVAPGSSAQSVLVSLLRRELQPAMPPAGPLAASVIDSIAAWIDRGALRE